MKKRPAVISGLMIATFLWAGSSVRAEEVDFRRDVLPILSDHCFQCHGPDEEHREAGLRLDTAEGALLDLGGYAAVVPGHADRSELVARIESADSPMPPAESRLNLSRAQKDTLATWIQQGAPFARHWAFERPQQPVIPSSGQSHPIDAFVEARLQQEGLQFSPPATPEKRLRRLSLDLTGLPPSPEDTDRFLQESLKDPDAAWEAAVDRLLASPRYGETMALPWLDAARFADTDGYQYDGPRYQWRWRDWVIDAYNSNMSFDQFTVEQLAGDLLDKPTLDQIIATGFNRNHRYNSEAGSVVEEVLFENAVDRVDTMSTVWMGLTAGCARCHNHKYDPISQKDYYRLLAFFDNVDEAGRAIKSRNSEPIVVAPTKEQQSELQKRRQCVEELRELCQPREGATDGEPLIDRRLAARYLLESTQSDFRSAAGRVDFRDGAAWFDGDSELHIGKQNKNLNLRANSRFSISFLVRPTALGRQIVLSRQKTGSTRPGVEASLTDQGALQFDLITRWLAGVGRVTTVESLPVNEWTHVTLTNDGSQSANGQLIWLNGVRAETRVTYNTNSNTGGVDEKRPIIVGGGIRPGGRRFQGQLRDLRFYSTNLWPEEIAVLGAPAEDSRRLAYRPFRHGDGYSDYVEARESLETFRNGLPTVMVMKERPQRTPTHVRVRGEYHALGPQVSPGAPDILPPISSAAAGTRLDLARWLVSDEHPLTARVAVNRYWQKYFGTGLVKTTEDFGLQGERPSHPQLLDWLAIQFMRSGWDIKALQKLIVTSRTYQQQSKVTPALYDRDPDNRLLARGPRRRLSGHVLRDQALFVSGLLRERIGGPSVRPYQPGGMWAEMSMGMRYKESTGDDLYRRSLYTIWKRTVAPPVLAVFDAADRETCRVSAEQTNTPLQALTLLNETGFVECARQAAGRVLAMESDQPLVEAFRLVTARRPSGPELRILGEALDEYRLNFQRDPEAAAALLKVGASSQPAGQSIEETAAWTMLMNVLLNMDETITLE